MNPPNNEVGMQLPPPMEQAPVLNPPGESAPAAPEKAPASGAEKAPKAQAPATAVPPLVPLPMVPAVPVMAQPAVTATTQSSTSLVADDGDLIEKEWVTKAKQIVERNRDDPYKQSEELTVVKADYMKQRYNKTIKLNK